MLQHCVITRGVDFSSENLDGVGMPSPKITKDLADELVLEYVLPIRREAEVRLIIHRHYLVAAQRRCITSRASLVTSTVRCMPYWAALRYTPFMTRTLDAAVAKLATLPPDEQDRVGLWLLDELRDDEHWGRQFAASQDALSKLAAEVQADIAAGRTTPLDPDTM
jgi:hypothetical protein